MPGAPDGTVTLLFTDIEGSTRLLQRAGNGYADLLLTHRRLLRQAFAAHGGYEVAAEGDAFFVAFSAAEQAVAAAEAGQLALAAHAWPEDQRIRVRMGLHTGAPRLLDGNYVGLDVHRAARVMAAGHGGQVILSSAARRALGERLPVIDLGEHRLKDLLQPERLYQLRIDGLQLAFPALKTLGNRATNLPVQPNALVGRERELADVVALLGRDEVRLVTLTGTGGAGKTRLATHAGAELLEAHPSGVFFVPLAFTRDPARVLPAILETLALADVPGQTVAETLITYLQEKDLLLILDNFEQVLDAAPEVARLLSFCPRVKVLVTSRERLRVGAEHLYEVPPLSVPAERGGLDPARLAGYGSVALFVERVHALVPTFRLDGGNADTIARICRSLDGLPLALELAAAQMRLLTPQMLLRRLGERLDLLQGGSRDADERQQTLRRTIEWSFDLLPDAGREALSEVAVFAGGASLEALDAILTGGVTAVAPVVEASLAQVMNGRLQLLESVRAFSAEKLDDSGCRDDLQERHASYFLDFARETAVGIAVRDDPELLDRLGADHDNLRQALTFLDHRNDARALELAAALSRFWYLRAHGREGLEWMRRTFGKWPDAEPAVKAKALMGLGVLTDHAQLFDEAAVAFREALELNRDLQDVDGMSAAVGNLGIVAIRAEDWPAARKAFAESLELAREARNPSGCAAALCNLGIVAASIGDFGHAEDHLRESLPLSIESGNRYGELIVRLWLGIVAGDQGRFASAREALASSLQIAHQVGDLESVAINLEELARVTAKEGDPPHAAFLLGVAHQIRVGIEMESDWDQRRRDSAAIVEDMCDEQAFQRSYATGATTAEPAAFALELSRAEASSVV